MTERYDYSFTVEDKTAGEIAERLRLERAKFATSPLRTWRWWSGFIWGCVFMTALNIGDVHICVGECDGAGLSLIDWSAK
jgi:hypothetical protein